MNRNCGDNVGAVAHYRMSEAAALLGVSDDTVRRWVAAGELAALQDEAGRQVVEGAELAALAQRQAHAPADAVGTVSSARNRLTGLVTAITSDTVMSQVELQCGPYRLVSLMSTEAVRDLGLEVGSLAAAVVKATMVVVEVPKEKS